MTAQLTRIHYLSTFPGIGKTYWARNFLRSRMLLNKELLFYVAPTKALLEEVHRKMLKDGAPTKKIHLFLSSTRRKASGSSQVDFSRESRLELKKTSEYAAEGRVYDKVVETITNSVEGPDALPDGCVLMMTHEAFIRLPTFERQNNITVVFDEARKFVLEPLAATEDKVVKEGNAKRKWKKGNEVTLDTVVDIDAMNALLGEHSEKVSIPRSKGQDGSIYYLLKPKLGEIPADLSKFMTSSDSSLMQYPSIKKMWRQACNPRFDVYVRVTKTVKGTGSTRALSLLVHEILIPSKVFHGYQKVILLGAYLNSSQMFHLLLSDRTVKLVDLRSLELKSLDFIRERESGMLDRFASVTVWPLTQDHLKISINKYDSAVVVPEQYAKEVAEALSNLGISMKTLLDKFGAAAYKKEMLRDGLVPPRNRPSEVITDAEMAFLDLLEDSGGHPDLFVWFMEQSLFLRKYLTKVGELSDHPPLLVANHVHTPQAKIYLMEGDEEGPTKLRPDRVFRRISAFSHGLNTYMDSNMIVYLAALNPPPDYCLLMKVILPDYEIDKDHAAEACIQAISRTNVRVGQSSQKVHVVLPDMGLANLVAEKMLWYNLTKYPHEVFKGRQPMVTTSVYVDAFKKSKEYRSVGSLASSTDPRAERVLGITKEINILSSNIRQAVNSTHFNRPTSKLYDVHRTRVAEYTEKREALRKERAALKAELRAEK